MPPIVESPRMKALKSAPLDSWILLSEDESTVLAVARTFEELSEKAAQFGPEAVMLKTPQSWASFSV